MLATAYTVCVSGSAPPPGQLVPPLALPVLIAPRIPFGSPTTGGLYITATRYGFRFSSAWARSAAVKSIRSSGTLRNGRPYAGGLVGNGCVGDVFSPGPSDCCTGRSSIGQIGWPVM